MGKDLHRVKEREKQLFGDRLKLRDEAKGNPVLERIYDKLTHTETFALARYKQSIIDQRTDIANQIKDIRSKVKSGNMNPDKAKLKIEKLSLQGEELKAKLTGNSFTETNLRTGKSLPKWRQALIVFALTTILHLGGTSTPGYTAEIYKPPVVATQQVSVNPSAVQQSPVGKVVNEAVINTAQNNKTSISKIGTTASFREKIVNHVIKSIMPDSWANTVALPAIGARRMRIGDYEWGVDEGILLGYYNLNVVISNKTTLPVFNALAAPIYNNIIIPYRVNTLQKQFVKMAAKEGVDVSQVMKETYICLLYTSPSPRD